jgi:hypothetical protein
MWKTLRILLLLCLLGGVASTAWLERTRSTSWRQTLWVGVFPVNGDHSAATAQYIDALRERDFLDVQEFFAAQARAHGVVLEDPLRVLLYPATRIAPPVLAPGAGVLTRIAWSLRLRWYARRRMTALQRTPPHIRLFVLYHDPQRSPRVPHSLGLQKGLLGVVYAFATPQMRGANNIVLAHELLHTLGATDKYDPVTDQPSYPDGYADPAQQPRWPQRRAEIMAGRIALSQSEALMPDDLRDVLIGARTAREINWPTP